MVPTTPDTLWLAYLPAENAQIPSLPLPGPWALTGRIDHIWHRPAWLWQAHAPAGPSPATNGRHSPPGGAGLSHGVYNPPSGMSLALVDRSGRCILDLQGQGPVPSWPTAETDALDVHQQIQEGTLRLESATFRLPPGLALHLHLAPTTGDDLRPAELAINHPGYGPLAGMRGAFLLNPPPLKAEIHQWSKVFLKR